MTEGPRLQQSTRVQRVLLAVNLAVAALLWFGYFTDFSLLGTIPDLVSGPLVAAFAIACMPVAALAGPTPRGYKLGFVPSLVGGLASVLLVVVMAIPPFTLGLLFSVAEIGSVKEIQTVASPDGSRVAHVYFTPVGAYAAGNGRIQVSVSSRWLPFVERDLVYESASDADEETSYVEWKDRQTLRIVGEPSAKDRDVRIGWPRFDLPAWVRMPVALATFLFFSPGH